MRILAVLLGLFAHLFVSPATAQDRTWLQIEAQPSLNTAMDRARAYAALFPDVEGYKLRTGWYGIALGPTSAEAAGARLLELRRQNLIPADSYLSDGASYGDRFWPVGGDSAAVTPLPDAGTVATEPLTVAEPLPEPDETPREARASEAALSHEEKMALQEALKWYGFYDSSIDGNYGPGTRASMAAWQTANAYEPTGILTTKQRGEITGNYQSDKAEFGFETVTEAESGIEITLPLALIRLDRYEPPFVHYADKAGSGLKVLLISEPGGRTSLAALYDILQSLEIIPPSGERLLEEESFTIRGRDDKIETLAFARTDGDTVKGYVISWNLADAARMTRILPAMQASFRSLGAKALDPGLVPLADAARRGLLAGLEVRRPKLSRSGFFVDGTGTVLTTAEAVATCGHITLERSTKATVSYTDAATGIALLTPEKPLSPRAVAAFATSPGRIGLKVSVSGYSYEDKLPAPVVTLGTVEDTRGLNGESGLTRLSIATLPGDAGGPVFADSGAVLGMLLPASSDATRQLPEGVAFAASASALTDLLTAQGLVLGAAPETAAATPDALARQARSMTVLVSCWD
jgi:peptidoglycan hydrolase-like protein with peptidoglycan-binding domain